MKLYCIVLVAFSLFSPSFCNPKPLKVNINNKSAEIFDATTLTPLESRESATNPPAPDTTDNIITIPANPTTLPPAPITTPNPPTTTSKSTTTSSTTVAPTTNSTTTSTTLTPKTTTKPTDAPKSTEPPAPSTTSSPHSKGRQFDGPSFIGGIVLACGLTAIGFVAFKFYKARTERNYHTLSNKFVYEMPDRNNYS